MRLICILLCLPLLFAGAAASPTAEEIFTSFGGVTAGFNDMAGYSWAAEAVDYLYARGMVSGVGDNRFAPSLQVTRLEFIKMICTASGICDKSAEAAYTDVLPGSWGYLYGASAKKAGLTDIYSENELGADIPISREDMAYIAYKAIKLFDSSESTETTEIFGDDAQIAGYAKDAVYYLRDAGIINGRGDNLFDPKGTAARAEAAKIIFNAAIVIENNYLDE